MIRTTFTIFVVFILLTSISHAQDVRLGGGLGYGTVIKNFGLNFRGDVKFDKHWSVTPHFNWFFNKSDGPITNRWNALNIDGHYYFEIDQTWTIYPLLGINIATVSAKINDITFSNSDIGINLGFGTEYYIDPRLSGFGEIKYVISDADQAVITLGVLYQITK
jgi:hypothetical protein